MYNFQDFLQDLSLNTGIKFDIALEDGDVLFSGIGDAANLEVTSTLLSLGSLRAILNLPKTLENCTALLKYTIENKYKEIFSMREQCIIEVLEGKEISDVNVANNIPFLSKGCTLFLINIDGSKYEALNITRQLYSEEEAISLVYKNQLLILGVFDETNEHAQSIRESIASDLYCKCTISYGNTIYTVKDINKAYEECKACFVLAKNFDIKEEILFYDKMVFEKIVYNVSSEVKNELLVKLKDKFDLFDSELISTIDEFVNSGLNISDAARRLYVHRNTLIYRLDKITKETGFDIRNFKEATVFIIAFLVWKENKH